ncbi:hypothetical protein BDB01DRAFT_708844, partial [Pilobolus umbonatus]
RKCSGINANQGTYPVLVDNQWRLDNVAQIYDSLVYIIPSDKNPEKELHNIFSEYPPPISFYVSRMYLF